MPDRDSWCFTAADLQGKRHFDGGPNPVTARDYALTVILMGIPWVDIEVIPEEMHIVFTVPERVDEVMDVLEKFRPIGNLFTYALATRWSAHRARHD